MKRLITFVALLATLASVGMAADTEQARRWIVDPSPLNYWCIFQAVRDDSNTIDVADTSYAFPLNPWSAYGIEFPDAISLYGVYTEVGSGNTAACGDCVAVNIDVNPFADSTYQSKASALWTPISGTLGSITYASRTGYGDTLRGITEAGSGVLFYDFTANQLSAALPYARLRWKNAEGASTTSEDSFKVDWYVIYKRDREK